jgi:Flp pilus assembly protein TadD
MIPRNEQEQKKEAIRLFEDGRYQESLDICHLLLESVKDPTLEILAATNLFYTGKLEEAEVFFRDIAQKMPESSYVHSFLANVLEHRGDDKAIAEYALAVHLDPTNLAALRSYADYLMVRNDFRGALPVLKRLVEAGKKPGDVQDLMQALIAAGNAEEALAVSARHGSEHTRTGEYVDALITLQKYRAAADAACQIYKETRDPAMLRRYLAACSLDDPHTGLDAYATNLTDTGHEEIRADYVRLLQANGRYADALAALQPLLVRSSLPRYLLIEGEILAALGNVAEAIASYERLIGDELMTKNDLEMLGRIIRSYRLFLVSHLTPDAARARFLQVVSQDVNVESLLETARLYEDEGNAIEARAWYYRAYRADYLNGGLYYAQFLSCHGEERECEKVMLYILSNVKKSADLGRVAAVILDKNRTMYRLKRLVDQLIKRLVERRAGLSSDELELLAIAFSIAAQRALDEADYAGCKYYSLCGLDVVPAQAAGCRMEDFLGFIRACKDQSIADRPVMQAAPIKKRVTAARPVLAPTEQVELSEQEQKIVAFIRSHRKATEMDLRTLLQTRRVTGIVNRLIQKAMAQGIMLIRKNGVGDDGEIYEYAGT